MSDAQDSVTVAMLGAKHCDMISQHHARLQHDHVQAQQQRALILTDPSRMAAHLYARLQRGPPGSDPQCRREQDFHVSNIAVREERPGSWAAALAVP